MSGRTSDQGRLQACVRARPSVFHRSAGPPDAPTNHPLRPLPSVVGHDLARQLHLRLVLRSQLSLPLPDDLDAAVGASRAATADARRRRWCLTLPQGRARLGNNRTLGFRPVTARRASQGWEGKGVEPARGGSRRRPLRPGPAATTLGDEMDDEEPRQAARRWRWRQWGERSTAHRCACRHTPPTR